MNPVDMLRALLSTVQEIAAAFPRLFMLLWRKLCDCLRRRTGPDPAVPCLPISAGVWLQADAYLYSQPALMALGMAVTRDNPDVTLTDAAGNVVGSHDLPATPYRLSVLSHNRAPDAPAPGLLVVFTLLTFGAGGTARQAIGSVPINLPVRAAPGEPTPASLVWTTPPASGHYCIEIEAVWPDDKFPIDNVGQHNTVIRQARRGERVQVHIPVGHSRQGLTQLRVRLDSYRLPERALVRSEREDKAAFAKRVAAANHPDRFPVDAAWRTALSRRELSLVAGGSASVDFEATVPASSAIGDEQRFNIAVADVSGQRPIGGATVIIQVAGP